MLSILAHKCYDDLSPTGYNVGYTQIILSFGVSSHASSVYGMSQAARLDDKALIL